MFQRLLVPLDGSLREEQAIPIAARIARVGQGMVVLVYPVSASGSHTLAESAFLQTRLRAQLDEAQQYLTAIASSNELAGLPLTVAALPGSVTSTVSSALQTYQPDLLVLCEHSPQHESPQFMGGLAGCVIEQATIPLLLIPAQGSHALSQKHPLTILVAYDGSQPARGLIQPASALLAALAPGGRGCLRSAPLSCLVSAGSSAMSKQTVDRRGSFVGAGASTVRSPAVALRGIPVGEEQEGAGAVNEADLLVLGIPTQQSQEARMLRKSGQALLAQWSTLPLLLVPLGGVSPQ